MLTRPSLLLKIEFAAFFLATILLYSHLHFSWLLFAILFLAPDLSMFGYLAGARAGSALYNLGHVLFIPLALLIAGHYTAHPKLMAIAIIWLSHIALDRLLGYGLKYPADFKHTHLQHVP